MRRLSYFIKDRAVALALTAMGTLLIGHAVAQVPGLSIASPTGLEQIEVYVPSTGTIVTNPQKAQVTINQIRNATGYVLVGAGTTVATQVANTAENVLATGAITTWNVNLPTAPFDGELVSISCPGGTASTLNVAATLPTGVTIVGTANPTCTSGGASGAEYTYTTSGNIWYRLR